MLKHVYFTTYYLQGNGQAKSTNKVIGRLLTKLVHEKRTYWDEHMFTIFFHKRTTYKVVVGYQLVHGLHPLMPIETKIQLLMGTTIDAKLTKVLTTRIRKLEKL